MSKRANGFEGSENLLSITDEGIDVNKENKLSRFIERELSCGRESIGQKKLLRDVFRNFNRNIHPDSSFESNSNKSKGLLLTYYRYWISKSG